MASTKKKILEEILPLRIIREVEKWPVLYRRDCPEMPNVHFKNNVWNEVAKALIEDWDTYSPAEKQCKILDLKKKWRNLRDTFKRQMSADKRSKGHNIKKKKYKYFKHMSFLLRDMESAQQPELAPTAPRLEPAPAGEHHACLHHIDEDKHFLMSLLPSFKRMSDDEKLTAKMEILKVIKEVRHPSTGIGTDTYVCRLESHDDDALCLKEELLTDECSALSSECDDTD